MHSINVKQYYYCYFSIVNSFLLYCSQHYKHWKSGARIFSKFLVPYTMNLFFTFMLSNAWRCLVLHQQIFLVQMPCLLLPCLLIQEVYCTNLPLLEYIFPRHLQCPCTNHLRILKNDLCCGVTSFIIYSQMLNIN